MIRTLFGFLLAVLVVALPLGAMTQTTPQTLTLDEVQKAREIVEKSTTSNEQDKGEILKPYDHAIADLQERQSFEEKISALDDILDQASQRMTELSREKSNPKPPRDRQAFESLSLERLESIQTELKHDLTRTQALLQDAQTRLSHLLGSTQTINTLLANRKTALEKIALELEKLPEHSEDHDVAGPRVSLLARQALYRAEIDYNQKILTNQSLLGDLALAQRDFLNLESARLQTELSTTIKDLIQERREDQARQASEEADKLSATAIQLPLEIEQLAVKNARIRTELELALKSESQMDAELSVVSKERRAIREDFEHIRQRVDIVGANTSISNTLRSRLSELPKKSAFHQGREARDEEISNATHRQLQIDDALRALTQQQDNLTAIVTRSAVGLSDDKLAQIESDAKVIMSAYRESLIELQRTWSRYINQLVTLDIAEQELVSISKEYATYIDQQLFWMPSTSIFKVLSNQPEDWSRWLSNNDAWSQITSSSMSFIKRNPIKIALGGLFLLLLLIQSLRNNEQLKSWSLATRKVKTDSITLTFKALIAHLNRALPAPALLFMVALVLRDFSNPVAESYANGLFSASLLLFSLGLLSGMMSEYGIARSHFGWPEPVCVSIRRELRWFMPFGAVLSFISATYASSNPPPAIQAIGSLSFVLLMLGWIYLTWQIFNSRGDLHGELHAHYQQSWVSRLHFIWYPFTLLIPTSLALLSLSGYHYTAIRLETRVQMTIWFLTGLFVVVELILRWLHIASRRLKVQEAIRRREEAAALRASEDDVQPTASSLTIPQPDPETDYVALSEQSRRLVHTGFIFAVVFGTWSIWVDLMPALGLLPSNRFAEDGTTEIAYGISSLMPYTTVDIIAGVFILVLTILSAGNIPGILEITLLKRLSLDAGARYAFTTLTQYGIAGIGLYLAFSTMGLPWDKLQWLIAALGVGLGFGLQEIVANFVSGIILLFERPIRVGDVVTVEGTTGVVTRIQIRATTITNYDRQELLVPNKVFITSGIINWTLSDQFNRILLPVGLSYESDVELAMTLMNEAAQEIPEILSDPAPAVTFEEFGSDSLVLYLRAYLANLDGRLTVITALHKSILKKFKQAGLVIAFPQRDIRLDVLKPIEVRMQEPLFTDHNKSAK